MTEAEIESIVREAFDVPASGDAMLRDVPDEVRTYARYNDRQLQELVEGGAHADPAFVELELRMNANLRRMVNFCRAALGQQLKTNVLLSQILEKLR